jgi:hypothetical protein
MILPDGRWVLGFGDSSPEIRKIKAFLRIKFRSYAGHLADTELFDEELVQVVKEVQRRYGLPATGYIGASLKERMGYWFPPPPPKHTIYSAPGTGAPWWVGYPFDIGRWVNQDLYHHQPVGYPAAVFPMGPSVQAGRVELIRLINSRPGTFAFVGHSQSEIVFGQVFKHDMINPNGVLHHRNNDLIAAAMFGGPMREAGKTFPGGKDPGGSGISGDRLENTPIWWEEYAEPGDIYAVNDMGAAGEDKRAIYNAVQGNVFTGQDDLLEQVFELVMNPWMEVPAAFKAIIDGIRFFGSGAAPHVEYHIREATPGVTYFQRALNHLNARGAAVPARA